MVRGSAGSISARGAEPDSVRPSKTAQPLLRRPNLLAELFKYNNSVQKRQQVRPELRGYLREDRNSFYMDARSAKKPQECGRLRNHRSTESGALGYNSVLFRGSILGLSAGTRLGPYEIVALLGAGGMGEVYRARDTRLGRDVAVKVLPESFAQDTERLHRFEQESRAIATFNHPNITAIFDVGTQNGSPFLVMELLEGESLRTVLERGALSQRKVIDYGVQMAQGLAAAHEKGIIHRDLKPENLFITKDGRVKILDFGLAKLAPARGESVGATMTGAGTAAGVVMGTASYMAPEQVRGHAADARTDIFALGAVLFEMISGHRVFHRDTPVETMTAVLKEDLPEMDATVSPALDRIVRRCLEKSPDQRFQSAKDLSFALGVLSGAGTSTALRAAEAAKKKSYTYLWVAVAALIAIIIVGVLWMKSSTPKEGR